MTKTFSFMAGAVAAAFLVPAFAFAAANTVTFGTIGTGATAAPSGSAIELYTPAGGAGSAYVRLNIPDGIALSSIASLTYNAQVITPGTGGYAPEVVLNVDANGNSALDGTGIAWMQSGHLAAALGGDNFLSGDENPPTKAVADGGFVSMNALGAYSYWSTDAARTGFGSFYSTFAAIVPGLLPAYDIDATDKVYSIDFVVGTSGYFDGMRALFNSVELNGTTYDLVPSTVKVVVNKFIDGAQATSGNANSSSFPMVSTTTASNINGGVETGGNAYTLDVSDAYHATTTDMASGASYATEEIMSGAVVGASCSAGKPFALVGYSSGDTLALAQGAATSTTAPSFTGLTGDKYVIVWNKPCLPAPVNVYPADGVTLTTAAWDKADWTDVTDPFPPIVYFYESSNSSATSTDGSFVTPAYQSGALSVSEIPTPGTPAGTWYWHARAQDADGNLSPWSAATRVIVDNTPPGPIPPPANACNLSTAPAGFTLQNGTTGNNTVTLAPNTMFVGHGGNDKVTAPDGNYIICTGSGNDLISLGNGDSTIDAGGGNNAVTTGNGAGSITTGGGNDTITTGNGAHTINAGGGNNAVTTGNGDQNVTTGAGNDTITTGNGAHTINAGSGNNTVTTGNGDQNVTTGSGNDKVTTGGGNDTINAGSGNNTVKSWAGDDSITTGSGNDSIDAGADTDSCSAGGGINTVVNCSP